MISERLIKLRQENFNKAYLALITQGSAAFEYKHNIPSGQYITFDGKKCAIGHIVPESVLCHLVGSCISAPGVPRILSSSGVSSNIVEYLRFLEFDREFYVALQCLHDQCHPSGNETWVERFKANAAVFAEVWKLTVPTVDSVA